MAAAKDISMEIYVAPWIQDFCQGMLREVAAWERRYPTHPVNHVFVLRCVQQFTVRFGVRVHPC